MQVAASDLARFGGSRPFTFRGIANTTHLADPRFARGLTEAQRPDEAPEEPLTGTRFDLVRGVVEQILGRALPGAEIDAISAMPQPVPVAFDRARQLDAVARARGAREAQRQEHAAARQSVDWSASLDLRETRSGDEAFAASGALRTPDGREVELEIRLVGDGTSSVLPLRLDIDLGPDGRPVRFTFTGRAVDPASGGGAVAAASTAWAGLPVRLHGADGSVRVTTLGDTRGGALGVAGGVQVDLVA